MSCFFLRSQLCVWNLLFTHKTATLTLFGHTVTYLPPPPSCSVIFLLIFKRFMFVLGLECVLGSQLDFKTQHTFRPLTLSTTHFSLLTPLCVWNLNIAHKTHILVKYHTPLPNTTSPALLLILSSLLISFSTYLLFVLGHKHTL